MRKFLGGLGDAFNNIGDSLNKLSKGEEEPKKELAESSEAEERTAQVETQKAAADVESKEENNFFTGVGRFAQDAAKNVQSFAQDTAKNVQSFAQDTAKNVQNTAGDISENVGKIDLFNSKLQKRAREDYEDALKRYEEEAEQLEKNSQALYDLRKLAIVHVKYAERHINQLANTPKEFAVDLQKIDAEIETFEQKENEIKEAEKLAKVAANGAGAGATLSALGVAVATMGPAAAMGIATTFGVASTGTAISALSGAAASNAALAWLGGGALAAGGGGVSAGSALLALAGPVGWTIAGVAAVGAAGAGFAARNKNEESAETLMSEREKVEEIIRKFDVMNAEVMALAEVTQTQMDGVEAADKAVTGTDYASFTSDEKKQAGTLVNLTLTLARLINEELSLED